MEVVDEKKNKRIAAASTIGLHGLLLVFFFFVVGWRAPDPPYGSMEGFVINLGFDEQGSGDIQPVVPIGSEQEEAKSEETQVETPQQEEKATEIEPEPKPVEEQLTANDETAVAIKDIKKEEKKEDKPVKPEDNPKDKTDQKVTTKEAEKPLAVYKPDATKKADGKTGQPGGEGDDVNKKGDKGQPDGQLGPGAYKGKAGGGGGGSSLNIDGWLWDEVPKVSPPGSESSGRVVFEIKVNAEGEIISIKTLERSLSLEMENICRREIEKLTFSKTGTNVPSVSTGKITFVVLSN
jgi:protein TonB